MNNTARLELGREALRGFREAMGGGDTLETAAIDLIANILHVVHAARMDPQTIARMAVNNVMEEVDQ